MDNESFKVDVGDAAIGQLGTFTRDVNLYKFFDELGLGKSEVGKEMDKAGRLINKMGRRFFNHRFGDGHLWWKELANRPVEQWPDVLEHLLSDFFTPAGLPYAFDGTMINNPDILKLLNVYSGKSIENWAMINGFQFISGASSIIFSVYDAATLSKGYSSDMALACDGVFIALNLAGGIMTANPFLIIAAAIKTTTVIRKSQMLLGIKTSSPFDLNVPSILELDVPSMFGLNMPSLLETDAPSMLDMNVSYNFDIEKLIKKTNNFDFMYGDKSISYSFS